MKYETIHNTSTGSAHRLILPERGKKKEKSFVLPLETFVSFRQGFDTLRVNLPAQRIAFVFKL